MTLTTPALLFPAISLLLLAYTNRFLVLAQLIRGLNKRDNEGLELVVKRQISNLRTRLFLIRAMQSAGVLSFLLCTIAMFLIFVDMPFSGSILFGLSLTSLTASLVLSLFEVHISTRAIEIELESMESLKGVKATKRSKIRNILKSD
ncbi:membrane protein [Psychrosphaera saromensis]|jgi:hypothetical protein|uniref:II family cellulose-binding protein n=1 Tax=Psychrosphaera saromensis TaxID=716813 RepID=A0A2S7UT00_9GAMM|nr:DUF2721 domain-containing protein [Psychrosphaera saromensis]PQJ53104.1 II family cellulose-binding protein [Psychrosphaera saromensis]GHB68035.1 membrane protein [Psychrosphaera saromensis]GLQ15143.1 membrane protein [Psychrosphaera saromensis]